MSTTLNALYYLNSWNQGKDIDGDMAHQGLLRTFKLDYSVASLERVDAFIDQVRTQHKPVRERVLNYRSYQNLLFFLAFYTGEVIARAHGTPPLWQSYAQVVREIPSHAEVFSDCFETSLCCRFPGVIEKDVDCFNPLYALTTRLFEEDSGKSIHFSSGLFLPPEEKATSAHDVVPPPLQPGLFSFPPTQRFASADFPYALNPPYWAKDDPVNYMIEKADLLLKQGRVVWGGNRSGKQRLVRADV